jgi:deoxycytidylate deaminase
MKSPPDYIIDECIKTANRSPCIKSKRGCAIFYENIYDTEPLSETGILGTGYNGLPIGECNENCKINCNKLAVHAEQRCIRQYLKNLYLFNDSIISDWNKNTTIHLIHAKTVDGVLVTSGGPSCWQCSREILDSGIDFVWLFHEEGWTSYNAANFHKLTLTQCGIL